MSLHRAFAACFSDVFQGADIHFGPGLGAKKKQNDWNRVFLIFFNHFYFLTIYSRCFHSEFVAPYRIYTKKEFI